MVSDEIFVFLVFVLLYLSDLLILRFDREFLLEDCDDSLKLYSISDICILRKRLEVLNPFTPYRLIYRSSLGRIENEFNLDDDLEKLGASKQNLQKVSFYCGVLGLVLFVNFPLLYVAVGFDYAFILTAILGYFIHTFNSLNVIKHRKRINIDTDKLAILLVVSFICLPLAINLARRITLCISIKSDPLDILGTFQNEELLEASREFLVKKTLMLIDEGAIDPSDEYQNSYAREKLGVCLLKN